MKKSLLLTCLLVLSGCICALEARPRGGRGYRGASFRRTGWRTRHYPHRRYYGWRGRYRPYYGYGIGFGWGPYWWRSYDYPYDSLYVSKLREEISDRDRKINDLEERIDALEDNEADSEKISDLKEKIADMKKENREIKGKLKEAEAELED